MRDISRGAVFSDANRRLKPVQNDSSKKCPVEKYRNGLGEPTTYAPNLELLCGMGASQEFGRRVGGGAATHHGCAGRCFFSCAGRIHDATSTRHQNRGRTPSRFQSVELIPFLLLFGQGDEGGQRHRSGWCGIDLAAEFAKNDNPQAHAPHHNTDSP